MMFRHVGGARAAQPCAQPRETGLDAKNYVTGVISIKDASSISEDLLISLLSVIKLSK